MKNKKALLFDLDGTLIDSVPDLALSINEMLEALEKETFSVDTIRAWVGNGADILVKRALTGSRDIDETLDPTLVSKALAIFLNAYTQNLCVDTVTYDNVHATLEVLAKAGFRMAI
ncbi:MAG: HAD hydrolase-like protein, partial [Thiovulaceae bacterium]|nr:HAD hydrolase-like protein [Sulfurimonadaceae bacterium]